MDKQLHICMIAFQYAPNIGGAQTRAANQATNSRNVVIR